MCKENVNTLNLDQACNLCPRSCKTLREQGQIGYCGMTSEIRIARAALHFWEEPCISGKEGSGAVFFSGCNMRCIFCQNHKIAIGTEGQNISVERLSEIFLELQEKGANNINLVTPSHYIFQIRQALILAKKKGLIIPIVYNTSAYERPEALRNLEGLIDIYLPDFKYADPVLAKSYSNAVDYPDLALLAIDEMVRQTGVVKFQGEEGNSLMKSGTMVRHLVLPGHVKNSKLALKILWERYGNRIYYSLMNQYTPIQEFLEYPNLSRKVTKREFEKVFSYMTELGIEGGYVQEGQTAKESFIPEFNGEGV